MTKNAFEMDIHNMRGRYDNAARNLLEHQRIPQETSRRYFSFWSTLKLKTSAL